MKQKLLLLLATFCFLSTQAQITLVNPEPDFQTTIQGPNFVQNLFPIDLNNDGQAEYSFRWDAGINNNSWFLHIVGRTNGANNTSEYFIESNDNLTPLEYGTPITDSNYNYNNFDCLLGSDFWGINFQNLGDKYIAFKSILNGVNYYGWILVNFTNFTLTIKQYAFTTNINGFFAGAGGALSVTQSEFEAIKLYPNPVEDVLNINLFQVDFKPTNFQILDLSGRIVNQGKFDISNGINCNSLSSGQYILQLLEKSTNLKRVQNFIKN